MRKLNQIVFCLLISILLIGCVRADKTTPPATPIFTVSQEGSTIQPYCSSLWSKTYNEDHNGWIYADCISAGLMIPKIDEELPIIYLGDTITFSISENAKSPYIRVYNSEYERVYFDISEGEFQSIYGTLESGTYYVSAVVTYSGKYIEALDAYESHGDEFTFKLIVEAGYPQD